MRLARYYFFLAAILFGCGAYAQTLYTVDQLPNPQVSGRTNVSDPDGLLPDGAIDSLNRLAAAMKQSTGAELAIAIVRDFDQNQDDVSFATALFRKWGVGKVSADNGLLLFIATDRKQYRFITGYGLEGTLPDVMLADIGRRYLVPAFREGAYGQGIISAIAVISDYLRQPVNQRDMQALLAKREQMLVTPWYQPAGVMVLVILIFVGLSRHLKKQMPALPRRRYADAEGYTNRIARMIAIGMAVCFITTFILVLTVGFSWISRISLTGAAYIVYGLLALVFTLQYWRALSIIRKSHTDDFNYNRSAYAFQRAVWWYVLFSPLVLLLIISEAVKRVKARKRLVPQQDKAGHQLTLIDRDQNPSGAPYLKGGQRKEEEEGVYSYDIWLGDTADNYKVIANEGPDFNKFDTCPKCHFKTLARPVVETVIAPSYTSAGRGKKAAHCCFCQYVKLIEMVTLSKLVEQSSSGSSSSSGSGGGSSSSSGSGSFGGGSTGGGGAGGRW